MYFKKISLIMVFTSLLMSVVTADDQKNEIGQFSFGFNYSPLEIDHSYIPIYYTYYPNNSQFDIVLISRGKASSEIRFSYNMFPKMQVIGTVDYNTSFSKTDYDYNRGYNDTSYSNMKNGYIKKNTNNRFRICLGVKGYIYKPTVKQVSPYILFTVGKQFSTYSTTETDKYPDDSSSNPEFSDNQNEFISDINSPILFQVGLGTEYFYNEIFSFEFQYRFDTSIYSGSYKSIERYTDNYVVRTSVQKQNENGRTTSKRISIGINMYF